MQPSRPQIDEAIRRQLLDNYLRNQQVQSSPGQGPPPVFHPSQFQAVQAVQTVQATGPPQITYDGERSETFSESRFSTRSGPTAQPSSSRSQATSQVPGCQVQVTDVSVAPQEDLPDNISIEDFSNLVKKWIEIDNWIKKTQETAKQKRKQKEKLGEVITHYMCRYNIEDVNTSEGKIRCKVRYVKSGVNQKVVKEKINELFKDNEETCNALITKIFEDRDKVERVSLRRIKIT
jgi:hypothetical protein